MDIFYIWHLVCFKHLLDNLIQNSSQFFHKFFLQEFLQQKKISYTSVVVISLKGSSIHPLEIISFRKDTLFVIYLKYLALIEAPNIMDIIFAIIIPHCVLEQVYLHIAQELLHCVTNCPPSISSALLLLILK